jgi:hypothetical protein
LKVLPPVILWGGWTTGTTFKMLAPPPRAGRLRGKRCARGVGAEGAALRRQRHARGGEADGGVPVRGDKQKAVRTATDMPMDRMLKCVC